MFSLTATCSGCGKAYGVFVGSFSTLRTKSLLESLARLEDEHEACRRSDPNLRILYPHLVPS